MTKLEILINVLHGSIFKNETYLLYYDYKNEHIVIVNMHTSKIKIDDINDIDFSDFKDCTHKFPYKVKTSEYGYLGVFEIPSSKEILPVVVYDFYIENKTQFIYKMIRTDNNELMELNSPHVKLTDYKIVMD